MRGLHIPVPHFLHVMGIFQPIVHACQINEAIFDALTEISFDINDTTIEADDITLSKFSDRIKGNLKGSCDY